MSAYINTAAILTIAKFPRGAGEILIELNPRPDSMAVSTLLICHNRDLARNRLTAIHYSTLKR